jgi:hypothetical protein
MVTRNNNQSFSFKHFFQSEYYSLFQLWPTRGPPVALEALQCGPSTDSEKRYFGAKPIRVLEKNPNLNYSGN